MEALTKGAALLGQVGSSVVVTAQFATAKGTEDCDVHIAGNTGLVNWLLIGPPNDIALTQSWPIKFDMEIVGVLLHAGAVACS